MTADDAASKVLHEMSGTSGLDTPGLLGEENRAVYEDSLADNGPINRIRIFTIHPVEPARKRLLPYQRRQAPDSCLKVSGRLDTYTLTSSPPYTALSYSWGHHDIPIPVRLDGDKTLQVTQNVHEALRMLRHPSNPVHLWIDAICINQADTAERSSQVSVMREIYAHATDVCIWLGMPAPKTGSIRQSLQPHWISRKIVDVPGEDWLDTMAGYREHNRTWSKRNRSGNAVVKVQTCDPPKKVVNVTHADVSRLVDQAHLAWWRRRWVVQEVVSAERCPHIPLGPNKFSWRPFLLACQCCWPAPVSTSSPRYALRDFQGIFELRATLRDLPPNAFSLLNLLHRTINLRSSNPHDQIYAVLSIASKADQLAIVPDYGRRVESVYGDLSQIFMEHATQKFPLDFLMSEWQIVSTTEPSWACDFTTPSRQHAFHGAMRSKSAALHPFGSATSNHTWAFSDHTFNDRVELKLPKPILDLDGVMRTCGVTLSIIKTIRPLREYLLPPQVVASGGAASTSNTTSVNWTTLSREFEGCHLDYLHRLYEGACEQNRGDQEDLVATHITLFTTENGSAGLLHRIENTGLSSTGTGVPSAGDIIVYLEGASMPLVLRRFGHQNTLTYALKGPCLLSNHGCGCRDGAPHDTSNFQTFKIR